MTGSRPVEEQRFVMGAGWQRWVFPSVWLVYLTEVVHGVHTHSSGAGAVVGYALVAVFAVAYAVAGPLGWQGRMRAFRSLYALTVGLTLAELYFAHESAFVFLVYVGALTVASGMRWTPAVIAGFVLVATFVPQVVGWRDSPDWADGCVIALVAVATSGFFHIIRTNRELSAARAEVARLAAETERSRIARDLHDLLGHSLTTITVKAGLARRLAEHGDPELAFVEIAEVEQLSRRTLGDVRAAVAGHREVTLAGELATVREVLRAAAIAAELPGSVDVVDPELHETFGWVLREGVTNVVRHSRASSCRITFGPRWIEIADTGVRGEIVGDGNGLAGLRERLAAVGGAVTATSGFTGFRLRAEVPADEPSPPPESSPPESSPPESSPPESSPPAPPPPVGDRALT